MAKDFSRFINFPHRPCGPDGTRITAGRMHIELCRRAAAEGMVLLENRDNALPLRQGEAVALFGNGSVDYVKGGGGSGIVYAPYVRNFYEGLRIKEAEGKIRLFHPLSDYYEDYLRSAPEREENTYQELISLDKIHQHGKEPMHRAGGLAFLIAHSGHGIIGSEHERISVNCDKLHISDLSDIIQ